jgi:ArsR family transcriptional regulator
MGIPIKDVETTCKAFANKRRIAIVQIIRKNKDMCVTDIADEIQLSFRSTSRHLLLLQRAGILDKEQTGPQMFYRLSPHLSEPAKKIIALF